MVLNVRGLSRNEEGRSPLITERLSSSKEENVLSRMKSLSAAICDLNGVSSRQECSGIKILRQSPSRYE